MMSYIVSRVRYLLTKDTYQYLLAISLGITYGLILNVTRASHAVTTILTLPGPLFLRALQCAVIPMMFFNITVSVTKIFSDGKGVSLGKRVVQLYFLTTLLAVLNGICMANIFRSLFAATDDDDDEEEGADIELRCPEGIGKVTMDSLGRLLCLSKDDALNYNLTESHQTFELLDEEGLLRNDALPERTLLEQFVLTFESLFPRNAVESFTVPNIISVIVIAFILGAAIVHLNSPKETMEENNELRLSMKNSGNSRSELEMSTGNPLQDTDDSHSIIRDDEIVIPNDQSVTTTTKGLKKTQLGARLVLKFCVEMSNLSNTIIRWIVSMAPLCMGFLIAASLADAGSLLDLLRNVGIYLMSCFVGMIIHAGIVLPALMYYFTGLNPYSYIFRCRKALLVAVSTASSAATLPVTIQCCIDSGKVSSSIANVVLPMGANINMDGTALGFPCAIMFLAHADNLASKINGLVWCDIALGSSLGSVGAAPVPSAGMVTMITVWQAAFPDYDVPSAISYVQAIDFVVDRLQTCINVFSDIIIASILQVLIYMMILVIQITFTMLAVQAIIDGEEINNSKKEII